jgi:hypothetical protein
MDRNRRVLLRAGALLPAAAALSSLPAMAAAGYAAPMQIPATTVAPDVLARDEGYWAAVASHFDITDEVNHLENGYWGAMGRETLASYQRHTAEVNRGNAWYGRHEFPAQYMAVQRQVAELLGVGADEIALTRGATEAMLALIGGYNRLRPGDQVLYADIDYDSMIGAMRWLQQRRGVQVERIALPAVPDHAQILQAYEAAFARLPRLKLVLLTQVSHRHGLVLPVAEIAERARARYRCDRRCGARVRPDRLRGAAAQGRFRRHQPAQVDRRTGRRRRDVRAQGARGGPGPYMGETDDGRVGSRVHTGTVNFAAYLALPEAIALHQRIGVANKQARLRYLRERWTVPARQMAHIEVLSSPDPALASALASFRLRGHTSWLRTRRCRSACWMSIGVHHPSRRPGLRVPVCG